MNKVWGLANGEVIHQGINGGPINLWPKFEILKAHFDAARSMGLKLSGKPQAVDPTRPGDAFESGLDIFAATKEERPEVVEQLLSSLGKPAGQIPNAGRVAKRLVRDKASLEDTLVRR
jgi:hypothetical protein